MNRVLYYLFVGILSLAGYSQTNFSKDSLEVVYKKNDSVLKVLEKEYIPFKKMSFNNGVITPNSKIENLIKVFNIKPKKCSETDEDGTFEYNCYLIGNKGTEIGNTSCNVSRIRDNLIYFDYYPELKIGKPISVLKLYFPARYNHIVDKYKNWKEDKKIKNRKQSYIVSCESYENAYPNHMTFLSLSIEFDLITMKITGFTFYDGYE